MRSRLAAPSIRHRGGSDSLRAVRALSVLSAALLLGGCASFSEDGGMGAVQAIAGAPLNKEVAALRSDADAAAARATIDRLLAKPLGADSAVQIALLNNRDLQAAYNALGIAESSLVQASLPPNPTFTLSHVSGSGAFEIERQVALNILSLATLPARAAIAADRFRQAQLKAAEETLRVAAETRRAFYRAVAARELAGYLVQSQSAAEAAVQLSQRLGESGAATKLDQARNQVFYAELAAQLGTARQRVTGERERLVRAMGLWGRDLAFTLPARLPPLPRRPHVLAGIEAQAVLRRVDLHSMRIEVEALAKSYGLTDATRFVSLLELAGVSKTSREEPGAERTRQRGVEVEFQIPLFDFGEVRVREAEQTYLQAVNRLTAKAVNVRSEARDAYHNYRAAYDVAGHYRREVLPLRKIISDETLLRYNAMQIDVFALLAEARQRIASTIAAIEAQREFWLADAALGTAVIGGGGAMGSETSTIATTAGESAGQH
jgi:outer membrane protein TolC